MLKREKYDVAVIGAGFAGCLTALILWRLGLRVVLIERGSHPRFVIGESSTPLANLYLENLCRKYHFPLIQRLCKYGPWQRSFPALGCGLKRGFSFFKHEENQPFLPRPGHENELLVAASPSDQLGDTHWYRQDVDNFFFKQALAAHVRTYCRTEITGFEQGNAGWMLNCQAGGIPLTIAAKFLLDASGAQSVLAQALGTEQDNDSLKTNSWCVYSHFRHVKRWERILAEAGGQIEDHPFHCDDAALHHIFDDGWMWVLRFNNGVTSAGFVLDGGKTAPPDSHAALEQWWQERLSRYPSVARQFAAAKAVRPFSLQKRLQRRLSRAAGPNWVCLPHSAYFIDPLYSSGIAHTLLAITRLAEIFRQHGDAGALHAGAKQYAEKMQREIEFLDMLVHGSYAAFADFALFRAFSLYYFAGAIHAEHRIRAGEAASEDEFLFSHDPAFRAAVAAACERVGQRGKQAPPAGNVAGFLDQVRSDIETMNVAGLGDPAKNNMYPFV